MKEKILRRFSPRVHQKLVCELATATRTIRGVTEDISHTGLSVWIETLEDIDKPLTVHLYHHDREIISIRGEVIRQTKTKTGKVLYAIRFLERKNLPLFFQEAS